MTELRRIVLARRPQGAPVPEDFRLETGLVPEPGPGEALVRTVWLSLDPYMRGRMSDARSYAQPVPLGGVIEGEVVGEVMESRDPVLRPGDLVRGRGGWQSHFCRPVAELSKVAPGFPASTALGVLGMPGLTAFAGLEVVGRPRPGEALVVGAASGPVGSLAGQLARRAGCRVIGIAGGADKCAWVDGRAGLRRLPRPARARSGGRRTICSKLHAKRPGAGSGANVPERPEAGAGLGVGPDVVAGERDVLPAEGCDVRQEVIRNGDAAGPAGAGRHGRDRPCSSGR